MEPKHDISPAIPQNSPDHNLRIMNGINLGFTNSVLLRRRIRENADLRMNGRIDKPKLPSRKSGSWLCGSCFHPSVTRLPDRCHRLRSDFQEGNEIAEAVARQHAAIVHTMAECVKRHGHNPEAWLTDLHERLPGLTTQDDLSVLLPSNWQPATAANKPIREICPA
jgi:hypothetical protein